MSRQTMMSKKNAKGRWAGASALRTGSAVTVAMMGVMGVQPAYAQASQSSTGRPVDVNEVIVTAEKRSSTVLDTAISISAVSGDDLQARGTTSIDELARGTPGVSMKTSGPGQTEFQMRGLSSSGGSSPTVAFYLDEVPVTPPASASNGKVVISPNLFDLARVEVLRGPQGTLYGAGSMGGTIKLITNKPQADTVEVAGQVIVSATEGGGINYTTNAMINVPIVTDKAALRLVGSRERRSGWIDRVVLDPFPLPDGATRGDVLSAPVKKRYKNVNDAVIETARAALLLRPTENLTITPSFFYEHITNDGMDLFDSPPGEDAHYQPSDYAEPFYDTFKLGSLDVEYDFGGVTLTNAFSYWDREQQQAQDASESIQFIFEAPTFIDGINSTETETTHQWTEELRLASSGNTPFQWLVGFFYSDFYSRYYQEVMSPGLITDYGLGTDNLFTGVVPTQIKQTAVFGQASYELTDTLTVTAGLRYYHYDSETSAVYTGEFASPSTPAEGSDDGFNPRINLSYRPTDDVMLYANVAKGYRPGGGNSAVPVSLCGEDLAAIGLTEAPDQYGPDSLWSYEAGAKGRLFDGALRIAGAVYYQDWNDVQQIVPMACGFNFNANSARAEVYGGELEAEARLGSDLTLFGNFGYSHAELAEIDPGVPFEVGDRLQSVPEWTWSVASEYRRPISDGMDVVGRGGVSYVGDRVDTTSSRNLLPSYTTANLRLGVDTGSWSAYVFANNLTNARPRLTNSHSYSVDIPTMNRVTTLQPRTIGADVSFRF